MRITKELVLRIANIFDNAGQVFLGSLVLTPIFATESPTTQIIVMIAGLTLSFACWYGSLKLTNIAVE